MWLWAVCVFCSALAAPAFLLRVYALSSKAHTIYPEDGGPGPSGVEAGAILPWVSRKAAARLSLFCFVIPLAVGLAVGLLLAWHTFLIATNQTTVEWYANATKSQSAASSRQRLHAQLQDTHEFNLGLATNWSLVFGVKPWDLRWLLPSMAPPPGNGVEYPTAQEPSLLRHQLGAWNKAYGTSLAAYIYGIPREAGTSATRDRVGPVDEESQPLVAAEAGTVHHRLHGESREVETADLLWGAALPLPPVAYQLTEHAANAGYTRLAAPSLAFSRLYCKQVGCKAVKAGLSSAHL